HTPRFRTTTKETPMRHRHLLAVLALASALLAAAPAAARDVSCRLSFNMSGWSVLYKTGSGTGHVRCDNGQSMAVRIEARGGGLSVGKSEIRDGRGDFSAVRDI